MYHIFHHAPLYMVLLVSPTYLSPQVVSGSAAASIILCSRGNLSISGFEYRRVVHASMESPSVSSPGLSASSTNLTLSLRSSPADRVPQRGYSERLLGPSPLVDIEKSTAVGTSGVRFDRHGPVERSDHEYGNAEDYLLRDNATPQTLVTEPPSRLTEYTSYTGTMRKSMKTPVPMPRTSIRSAAPPSGEPSAHSITSSYEMIDNVPTAALSHATYMHKQQPTLGIISEHSASSESSGHSVAISNNNANQPTRLSKNVAISTPVAVQTVSQTAYSSNQVCDVCHNGFPRLTQRQFLDHCLECADKAAAEEEGAVVIGGGIITQESSAADLRTCPLCQRAFGNDVPQTDFENHVQGHFMEEESRITDNQM